MIKISDKVLKKQKNFWNDALFHPTDVWEYSAALLKHELNTTGSVFGIGC